MKTLLVPTDFSDNAKNATVYAVELAKKIDANVILFHVYHTPVYTTPDAGGFYYEPDLDLANENQQIMQKYLEDIRKITGTNVPLEGIVKEGFALEEINREAEERKVDLVIMGTQGANGLAEIIMGSNTSSFIMKSKVPVLAIPKYSMFCGIERIVYTTEFQFEDFKSLESLAELASLFKAEIVVLNVCTKHDDRKRQEDLLNWFTEIAEKRIAYRKIKFEIIESNTVLDGVNALVHSSRVDMVAMSTVKRNLFDKIFHTSMVKKMSYHTEIPLLAFHISEDNPLH